MQKQGDIQHLEQQIKEQSGVLNRLQVELHKVVVGQQNMINMLLIGLLSNGHVLLEGVPGLAKTLTIKSLANAIDAPFSRIQFTPDLLPADILGTMIYNQQKNEFVVRKGPLFSNFILADEINRAPAKVQSALLEAMQEKQVTIGGESYPLSDPFLVLATQNPLEQEGTYPLPEAQADRFMLKVTVGYPTKEEEIQIVKLQVSDAAQHALKPVCTIQDIVAARALVKSVYLDEKIEKYIVELVFATRYPEQHGLNWLRSMIGYGASPRASIHLAMAAKAFAYMQKRAFVIPEDVKAIAFEVLRHRIGLTYEAEAENITTEKIITEILKTTKVP